MLPELRNTGTRAIERAMGKLWVWTGWRWAGRVAGRRVAHRLGYFGTFDDERWLRGRG